MTTILLIRHAENDYLKKGRMAGRLPGVYLNEEGRLHAQALAEALAPRLKELPVQGIFSSALERAQETAQPLAQALGLPVMIRAGLMETDAGDWTGKTTKSLSRRRAWKVIQQNPTEFQFPGGESFVQMQQRFVAEVDALRTEFTDPKAVLLCFSHADPIKLGVAHYLGMGLDSFQRLVVHPASVTVLQFDGPNCRLLGLNWSMGSTFG
jgi:probable phosphomutase (TIGR03848 family)